MSVTQIIAIDCGTQSVRCLVVDVETGAHRIGASEAITMRPTDTNRIEVDPRALADAATRVLRATLASCPAPPVAIAITNMRETAVAWDRRTGEPVHDGIMWMSQQSQNIVDRWKDEGLSALIRDRTGLTNHTLFFGSKIAWLFDAHPDLEARAARGDIAVGTVESWLLFVLTGGQVHATDVSNASRYQLLNLRERRWDPELTEALGIPASSLPDVLPTSARFGETAADVVGAVIPITGMIGDQQASLLGHDCLDVGDAKVTFGTSGVVCVNVGSEPLWGDGLVTSIGWSSGERVAYEMEGSAFHSGYTIGWLNRMLASPPDLAGPMERSVLAPDQRVMVVPSFTEMGAPRWLKGNGASVSRLRMDTEPADILRAGIESTAYQAFDLLSAVPVVLSGRPISLDGGAASSDYLCQLLADASGQVIVRPPSRELTGFGAAQAAAATLGIQIPAEGSPDGAAAAEMFVPAEDRSYAEGGFEAWLVATGVSPISV